MLSKYYDSMARPAYDLFDVLLADPIKVFDDTLRTRGAASYLYDPGYRAETTEKGLDLSIDLPGVKSTDLSVSVSDRTLTIEGKHRGKDFKHSYKIAKDYDPDTVSATLEDGVLSLHFDKSQKSSSRKVDVKVK